MTQKIPCALLAVAVLLAGCQEPAPPPPEARPVGPILARYTVIASQFAKDGARLFGNSLNRM